MKCMNSNNKRKLRQAKKYFLKTLHEKTQLLLLQKFKTLKAITFKLKHNNRIS